MTQEIQIRHSSDNYETKSFTFPGGEIQVQIPGLPENLTGDITVLAPLQSADDRQFDLESARRCLELASPWIT